MSLEKALRVQATGADRTDGERWEALDVLGAKVRELQAENAEMGRTWVAEVDELRAEVRRLHTWEGLMSLLDEHYPADVPLGPDSDPGPRILRLTREVHLLQLVVAQLRANEQRLRELAASAGEWGDLSGQDIYDVLGTAPRERPIRSGPEGEPRGEDGGQ